MQGALKTIAAILQDAERNATGVGMTQAGLTCAFFTSVACKLRYKGKHMTGGRM